MNATASLKASGAIALSSSARSTKGPLLKLFDTHRRDIRAALEAKRPIVVDIDHRGRHQQESCGIRSCGRDSSRSHRYGFLVVTSAASCGQLRDDPLDLGTVGIGS
jgi:hypothetical protein